VSQILFIVLLLVKKESHILEQVFPSIWSTCRKYQHMTRPPTQSDSYQRLYWHSLSLLMISTMCSKHVES